jgi:hypothetical protein
VNYQPLGNAVAPGGDACRRYESQKKTEVYGLAYPGERNKGLNNFDFADGGTIPFEAAYARALFISTSQCGGSSCLQTILRNSHHLRTRS